MPKDDPHVASTACEAVVGVPVEQILAQLRARQVAEEQIETFARQEKAALKERELREARARTDKQEALTSSELSIAILPEARGHGVGRSLLDRLLEAAKSDGFSALSLSVGRANTAARRLYERRGFKVVASDDAEDGLTMRVALR